MKKLIMIVAVLGLFGIWLPTGMAAADEWNGTSETKTVGTYQVEFITPADGSKLGDNHVAVQLKDVSSGQPVVRNSLQIDFLMDEGDASMSNAGMANQMASQKPVVVDLKPVNGVPGRYEGKTTLSDSGDWNVRVFVDPKGLVAPATFKTHVAGSGPNLGLIGGVVAIVAIIVVGMSFLSRHRAKQAQLIGDAFEVNEA